MSSSSRLVNSGTCLWPSALIVWGPGSVSPPHTHDCAQVTVALTGTLRVREGPQARWRRCRAVVVKAHAGHEIDASGATVLVAFVGVENTLDAAVTALLASNIGIVSNGRAQRWRRVLGDGKALDSGRAKRWALSTLLRSGPAPHAHPRVERVLRMLANESLGNGATSLVGLSRVAGLSASRFGHVFTESTGIPLRPYMRWLRLQRAARELVSGRSATHAAHIAGFADAAHLTRTFRRMLGATPRDLIERASNDRRPGSR